MSALAAASLRGLWTLSPLLPQTKGKGAPPRQGLWTREREAAYETSEALLPQRSEEGTQRTPQTQEIEFPVRFPVLDGETEEGRAGVGGQGARTWVDSGSSSRCFRAQRGQAGNRPKPLSEGPPYIQSQVWQESWREATATASPQTPRVTRPDWVGSPRLQERGRPGAWTFPTGSCTL